MNNPSSLKTIRVAREERIRGGGEGEEEEGRLLEGEKKSDLHSREVKRRKEMSSYRAGGQGKQARGVGEESGGRESHLSEPRGKS